MDTEKARKPRTPRKNKPGNVMDEVNTGAVQTGEASAAMDATLHLSAGLEIKDVESVHRQLTGMLDRGAPITVDISHVAAMDTAGVQLLLAFQSEAAKRGVSIEYSGRSTAFTHALTAVGLGDAVPHVASRD